MRSHPLSLLALLAALALGGPALALEPTPATKAEIEQLFNRLAASGCTFQRNGIWYTAADAKDHLQTKYKYLLDKQMLGTAEDFIHQAATKSSVTGKPYAVKCGAEQVPSAVWLSGQLKEVRAKAGARTGTH